MTASVYGNRLAYNDREVPWHALGTAIPDDATVEEGVEVSQTDYPIMLGTPYGFTTIDDNPVLVTPEMIESGTVSNSIAVLRGPSYDDPNYAVLGQASTRFSILQNKQLAEIVEPLRKWGRLETIGALDDGARFFISFQGGEWATMFPDGRKDAHTLYLVVKNTHLPGAALQFQLTNVRPVCKNTWMAGDRNALMNLPIAHTGDIKMIANWVVGAMDSIPERLNKIQAATDRMAATPMNDREFKKVAELVFPITKERRLTAALRNNSGMLNVPMELQMVAQEVDDLVERKDRELSVQNERKLALQRAAFETWNNSETIDRGSSYGGFNAITETIDHVVRSATATHQTRKAMGSNFWGERANWKIAAYDTILDVKAWAEQN